VRTATQGAAVTVPISFTNPMRSTNVEDNFFRTGTTDNDTPDNSGLPESHGLWLNLTDANGAFSQTYTGYVAGGTPGVDNGIDSRYINDSQISLTSVINDIEYIIQGRGLPFAAENTEPLQLKVITAGDYTITLDHVSGLFEGDQEVYLKDNVLGLTHNIKETPYTFATEAGTFGSRFEVVYTTSSLGTNNPVADANSIVVYKQDNTLHVNSGNMEMSGITVYDVRGRIIYSKEGINATETVINGLQAEQQVLIVKITTKENGTVSKKVIY